MKNKTIIILIAICLILSITLFHWYNSRDITFEKAISKVQMVKINSINQITINGDTNYKNIVMYRYEPPLDYSDIKVITKESQANLDTPESATYSTMHANTLNWYYNTVDDELKKYERDDKEYMLRLKQSLKNMKDNPYVSKKKGRSVKFYYKFSVNYKNTNYVAIVNSMIDENKEVDIAVKTFKEEINQWKVTITDAINPFCFNFLAEPLQKQEGENIKPALEAFEKLAENFGNLKENGNY